MLFRDTSGCSLTHAYAKTPERYVKGPPTPPLLPSKVHFNPRPMSETTGAEAMHQRGGKAAAKSEKTLAVSA